MAFRQMLEYGEPEARRPRTLFSQPYVNEAIVNWDPLNAKERAERLPTYLPTLRGPVFLSGDVDPQPYFDAYSHLVLSPDDTYRWQTVTVNHSLILEGNGASIESPTIGPTMIISGTWRPATFATTVIKDIRFIRKYSPYVSQKVRRDDSAIQIQSWGVTVLGCTFENFQGAAIVTGKAMDQPVLDKSMRVNQQDVRIENCSFRLCKIGVGAGGNSEYGSIVNCQFYQCHVGINIFSGSWNVVGCFITNTPFGILTNGTPWYLFQSSLGQPNVICGCTIVHGDKSMWPSTFAQFDKSNVTGPIGIYFDRVNGLFPQVSGCVFAETGTVVGINNCLSSVVSLTGCHIVGTNKLLADGNGFTFDAAKVYFIGCSKTSETLQNGGAKAENQTPKLVT